jgi:uncharacterized repeat protein (TIGR01451 family)
MRSPWQWRIPRRQPRRPGRPANRVRRVITGGLASALALVGFVAFATPAFAHNDIVTAAGSCASPLGSGFTVTWSIENDYNLTETGSVTSVTGGLGTLNGTSYSIAASPGTPYASAKLTQTLPASASGTITLDISSKWSDGYSTTDSGSFNLSSLNCAAPKQTIAGHIDLCNDGNPTTTEETGGTLAAGGSGLSTVGPSPNPLGATDVVAGSYTMTATSPPNFLLVSCGAGSWTPIGTTATQPVTVPTGGAGVGTFYVIPFAPAISLTKSASISSYSAPGTLVTYSYLVKNTGNVTLNPVTVSDPMSGLSAITCPATSLAAGASETCHAAYTTTQADVDNGSITNTATATGTPPWGPKVSATSSVCIPATQTPAITLKKTASITGFSAPGVGVTYFYAVTNTGNVTLNPVTVSDPMSGLSPISCPDTSLAPGGSETCHATYTTTQADVDNGSITNTGTATGHGAGRTVTAQSSVCIPATQTPTIALLKTADHTSFSTPGTVVTYSYLVTNTGNVTLNPVTVTDPMSGLSPVTCPDTALAPEANETCHATYTTTQADVDHGSIANTGTATGHGGGKTLTATSSVVIPAIQTPAISLLKSADHTSFWSAGTLITYSYLVTNTGNVTLDPVTVSDPMSGLSAITCPVTSLAPAVSETCHATYTTTHADVHNGTINNTGTATGHGGGKTVTAHSSVTIPGSWSPAISLVKSAWPTSFSAPGTVITYSYWVTNTGNVTLHHVGVTDPMHGLSPITCPYTYLVPTGSEACHATYTTTQADVDHGSIHNIGTARGTGGGKTVLDSSWVVVPAEQTPAISVVKTANVPAVSAVGQTVTYTFALTNTGNVTLGDVEVTDAQAAPSLDSSLGPITCTTGTNGSITLAPGATDTCSAPYAVTQDDITHGSVLDTATVTGNPPCGGTPVRSTATLTLAVTSLSVTKSASPSTGVVAGATTPIVYGLTVHNTGTATTTAATDISDAAPSGTTLVPGSPACVTSAPPTCTVAVGTSDITWTIGAGLAPGASFTVTFAVTANATDATGTIANTATWTGPSCGTPGTGPAPVCTTNTTHTPVTAAPVTGILTVAGGTGSTTSPTTPPTASPGTPADPAALAFTGALLTQEWIAGVLALLAGASMVVLARRRRVVPRHAVTPKHAAPRR